MKRVKKLTARLRMVPVLFAVALVFAMTSYAMAQAPPLIPASPVALEDFIGEGSVAMGVVVAAAVGAWFIWVIVKKGLGWARKAL